MLQGECDPCGVDVFRIRSPGALPPAIHIHPLRGCFSLALYIICENGLKTAGVAEKRLRHQPTGTETKPIFPETRGLKIASNAFRSRRPTPRRADSSSRRPPRVFPLPGIRYRECAPASSGGSPGSNPAVSRSLFSRELVTWPSGFPSHGELMRVHRVMTWSTPPTLPMAP